MTCKWNGHAFLAATLACAPSSVDTVAQTSTFRIVSAYEGLAEFVTEASANQTADRASLYLDKAIRPFQDDCRPDVGFFEIPPHTDDLESLATRIDKLRQSEIEHAVRAGLEAADVLLPSNMTVCINLVTPSRATEALSGVAGAAIGGNRVMLLIDPLDRYSWQRIVPYTIAHEFHHEVAFARSRGRPQDGLSIMLREGRADAFASSIYSDSVGPWTTPLDPEEETTFWQQVSPHLAVRAPNFYQQFMFGLREGLAPWAGYRMGFKIVQTYLELHPDMTPAQWTDTEPSVILSESGLRP